MLSLHRLSNGLIKVNFGDIVNKDFIVNKQNIVKNNKLELGKQFRVNIYFVHLLIMIKIIDDSKRNNSIKYVTKGIY